MEMREITEDELQEAFLLSAQAFGQGGRDDDFAANRRNDPNRLPSTSYGLWDAQGLQAKVSIIHYRQHFGPSCVFPMGGIGGVVSLPASRGKGYAGTMLRHALEKMRENGEFVSDLFPFNWEFYRRLGWAWVGQRCDYVVPTRILLADKETEHVRAVTAVDRAAIQDCYTTWAGRYRGLIERDVKLWNRVLDDSPKEYAYTFLYEADGKVEGYLTFKGWKSDETKLREFVVLTPRAQRALLGLLRRHEMQVDAFAWHAPGDDSLWHPHYHWDIKTKTQPVTAARVVDVAAAIAAWKPNADVSGKVIVRVQDDVAAWNTGTWEADFNEGMTAVKRVDSEPDVSLDIQAFSQAYHGTPDVASLRKAGRIDVHSEAGYAALGRLLDGPPMWMNDSF
ncbi:MAG: GCN5-related N-acetyltransferase [Chthonomonadaceae bacterium]|nr:GCN5-related N-acetyltransferase [Chthonomonadaceae bacterium]